MEDYSLENLPLAPICQRGGLLLCMFFFNYLLTETEMLTPEEWRAIQSHVVVGNLLSSLSFDN
jgi:hypothetical protein